MLIRVTEIIIPNTAINLTGLVLVEQILINTILFARMIKYEE